MPATLITQAQLEARVGARTVAQYCNDSGGATADSAIVDAVLEEAEDEGIGLLGPGFTADQVAILVDSDSSVRGAFLDIAADLMGRRRPALVDSEGRTPFTGWRKRAQEVLERASQAQRRFAGERYAGTNKLIGSTTNRDPPSLLFVGTKDNPRGSGGF